jgi:choline dehydrogenase
MRSANPIGITNPARFAAYQWPELRARRSSVQQPFLYDRGRGLGGSSAINWQVAHRAMLEDYDGWARQGCIGWSGEELLPAMIRLENDLDFGDMPYHGRGGPITIHRPPVSRWSKLELALLQAALDLGYPWHADLNAPGSTGITPLPMNRTTDNRLSTNDAYLDPARGRPNLTIRGGTHVDRVLFDGHRARGVRARGSEGWTELAAREVILSAGSVFTPPILIRSGIGPAGELRALGIPVRRDLPVGRNLREHPGVGIRVALRPEARVSSRDDRIMCCYIHYSSGLGGAGDNDMIMAAVNMEGYDEAGLAAGVVAVGAYQSFSEGVLRVVDPDPFAMPEIDERLLSDERDLVRLRDGARRLFAIAQHPAVQSVSESIRLAAGWTSAAGVTDHPVEDVAGDAELDAWLLAVVRDDWHLVGTCRMGAADDPRSVVDPDCRVLGVEGLRVIDGSIMPEVTRANTNLPIMTIAEHMAARLRRAP